MQRSRIARMLAKLSTPILKGLLCLLLLTALLLFQGAVSIAFVHAASNGEISGTLLDASNKNVPLAQQPVTLQIVQQENAHDLRTLKTDRNGHYTFSGLDTDPTISYVLYTNYQGAQYTGSMLTLNNKPVQHADLAVYEATTSTKNIAVTQATILMQQPDTARGTITISEDFTFQNLNPKTYVGSLDASKGKPNALLFSLPSGIRNITLGDGFAGYQVIQVTNGFASNAALLPGVNTFSFSYEIPYMAQNYLFNYETQYPTVQMNFLVDPTLHATSGALTSHGMVNANQHIYHSFVSETGLVAQSKIGVSLEGLPTPQSMSSSDPSFNAARIWLIAILIVLIAIVVLTWFLYRSRRKKRTTPARRQRQSQAPAPMRSVLPDFIPATAEVTKKTDAKQQLSPRQKQEDALLHELLALDKAHADGSLEQAAYERQRGRVKERLRSMLSEDEASV
jgi:hypothetical protein